MPWSFSSQAIVRLYEAKRLPRSEAMESILRNYKAERALGAGEYEPAVTVLDMPEGARKAPPEEVATL